MADRLADTRVEIDLATVQSNIVIFRVPEPLPDAATDSGSDARAAEMPLAEISLDFGSLHITARELRGGAIIFLFPQTALPPTPNHSRP